MKVFMERFTCAVKDAIILQALNKSRTSRVLVLKLFREQSVWRIQLYHFFGILPKKRSFRVPDLINPANNLMDKI